MCISTIACYAVVASAHARAVHDETMWGLRCTEVQAHEKWAFMGKKEARCEVEDREQGF